MSEYQYYEFVAVDRPLTAKQQGELRALTTRATITATRLRNEYHWGDFKGDPLRLMEKYFDAHLYFANWGTRILMLRLPEVVLPPKTARAFLGRQDVHAKGRFTILTFASHDDSGEDDGIVEGAGRLASLLSLRTDLGTGDLRALKIAWLARVQSGELPDIAPEPSCALAPLSAPLRELADFLRVGETLLKAASRAPATTALSPSARRSLAISRLPSLIRDTVLHELAAGRTALARQRLLRAIGEGRPEGDSACKGRTAGELKRQAGME